MKKHIPNILLLVVILVNVFFMAQYIRNHGLGLFFSITGMVLLILGIIIFIFFLSIDPGYGWTRSMDLSRNYIMIFTSLAVSIGGIVLIVTGQHMNELYEQQIYESRRCGQLIAGNAEEVMKNSWYSLQDTKVNDQLRVYLFQKKSDRNNYKILATLSQDNETRVVQKLIVTSDAIALPVTVEQKNSTCPGVLETDISIDFNVHQKLDEQVQFSLLTTITENIETGLEQTFQFMLKNKNLTIGSQGQT